MNILYFCQLYPPSICGGGEYIFFNFARELVKRGHRVFTITQRLRGTENFQEIEGIYIYRVGPAINYEGRLPPRIIDNLGYVLGAVLKGLAIIGKNNIDVIHSNTYAPVFAGQICATVSRKPHIVTVHDIYSLGERFWKRWSCQRRIAGSVSIIGPLVEKLILGLPATVFHTVSETSKRDLTVFNVKNVVVIPNGVNLDDNDLVSAGNINTHQAIFIGRLVFYKNIDILIRAMKKVAKVISDSKLVIVGDGPMRGQLEALVKRLGLISNVFFKGNVSDEEKVRLLKESSFLVLPSVFEGFGIVVIESFACRRPVLVSNVMPLPEIVENGENGLLIPPFDVESWANKMLYLFRNPILARRMGEHGRKIVEQKYAMNIVVDHLERLYHRLSL